MSQVKLKNVYPIVLKLLSNLFNNQIFYYLTKRDLFFAEIIQITI